MRNKNKFAAAVSAWTNLPELSQLGYHVHKVWHDPAVYRRIGRREFMRRVANDLLMRLDSPELLEMGVQTLPPDIIAYAENQASRPISVEKKLLADALSGALFIIARDETELNDWHELGGRVYCPLLVLIGLRMNPKARALAPRKGVSSETLEAFRLQFIKTYKVERGWKKAAAIEHNVDRKTITQIHKLGM